jgi:hypothetical protein
MDFILTTFCLTVPGTEGNSSKLLAIKDSTGMSYRDRANEFISVKIKKLVQEIYKAFDPNNISASKNVFNDFIEILKINPSLVNKMIDELLAKNNFTDSKSTESNSKIYNIAHELLNTSDDAFFTYFIDSLPQLALYRFVTKQEAVKYSLDQPDLNALQYIRFRHPERVLYILTKLGKQLAIDACNIPGVYHSDDMTIPHSWAMKDEENLSRLLAIVEETTQSKVFKNSEGKTLQEVIDEKKEALILQPLRDEIQRLSQETNLEKFALLLKEFLGLSDGYRNIDIDIINELTQPRSIFNGSSLLRHTLSKKNYDLLDIILNAFTVYELFVLFFTNDDTDTTRNHIYWSTLGHESLGYNFWPEGFIKIVVSLGDKAVDALRTWREANEILLNPVYNKVAFDSHNPFIDTLNTLLYFVSRAQPHHVAELLSALKQKNVDLNRIFAIKNYNGESFATVVARKNKEHTPVHNDTALYDAIIDSHLFSEEERDKLEAMLSDISLDQFLINKQSAKKAIIKTLSSSIAQEVLFSNKSAKNSHDEDNMFELTQYNEINPATTESEEIRKNAITDYFEVYFSVNDAEDFTRYNIVNPGCFYNLSTPLKKYFLEKLKAQANTNTQNNTLHLEIIDYLIATIDQFKKTRSIAQLLCLLFEEIHTPADAAYYNKLIKIITIREERHDKKIVKMLDRNRLDDNNWDNQLFIHLENKLSKVPMVKEEDLLNQNAAISLHKFVMQNLNQDGYYFFDILESWYVTIVRARLTEPSKNLFTFGELGGALHRPGMKVTTFSIKLISEDPLTNLTEKFCAKDVDFEEFANYLHRRAEVVDKTSVEREIIKRLTAVIAPYTTFLQNQTAEEISDFEFERKDSFGL